MKLNASGPDPVLPGYREKRGVVNVSKGRVPLLKAFFFDGIAERSKIPVPVPGGSIFIIHPTLRLVR